VIVLDKAPRRGAISVTPGKTRGLKKYKEGKNPTGVQCNISVAGNKK
jgi:hypothetical protein